MHGGVVMGGGTGMGGGIGMGGGVGGDGVLSSLCPFLFLLFGLLSFSLSRLLSFPSSFLFSCLVIIAVAIFLFSSFLIPFLFPPSPPLFLSLSFLESSLSLDPARPRLL